MSWWKITGKPKQRKYKLLVKNLTKKPGLPKLTPQEYDSLKEMFTSPMESNHWMAYSVLQNLDEQLNMIYLIMAMLEIAPSGGYRHGDVWVDTSQSSITINTPTGWVPMTAKSPVPRPGIQSAYDLWAMQNTGVGIGQAYYNPKGNIFKEPPPNTGITGKEWENLVKCISFKALPLVRANSNHFGKNAIHWPMQTAMIAPVVDAYDRVTQVRIDANLLAKMLTFYPEDMELIDHRIQTEVKEGKLPNWIQPVLEEYQITLKPKFIYEEQPRDTGESQQDTRTS